MSTDGRFGNDIVLANGDLVINTQGNLYTYSDYEKKNAATTKFTGYYNILYALLDRILTAKGDNIFHPNYGSDIPTIVSTPGTGTLKQQITDSITQSLQDDPRVVRVTSVDVTINGNSVSVKIYAQLIGDDKASQFVFPSFVLQQ